MPSLLHGQAEARGQRRSHREVRAPLRSAQVGEVLTQPSEERRGALLAAKLGALVRKPFGVTDGAPSPFPAGAALRDGAAGRAWILLEGVPADALGPAMAWARQHHVGELHLLAEDGAGALARRAAAFVDPPKVWWVQGTELHDTEPEPLPPAPPLARAPELEQLLVAAGLELVVEHAHVAGELRGLEVARIALGDDGAPRLEVGVGQADRELTAMLHGNLPPEAALERVAAIVGAQRRPGAPPHPLNRLVPERWLRSVLSERPDLIGLTGVRPVRPPAPRTGLRERDVAIATGTTPQGGEVVVVSSIGVDLDFVPAAAEARSAIAPGAPLLLVLPARDLHPVTQALAASLREPASFATVGDDWRGAVTAPDS